MLDSLTSASQTDIVPKSMTFSDELRAAVRDCGRTRYWIHKRTGLDQALLSRFISGERDMSLRSLDLLAAALDLHVAAHSKTGSRNRKRETSQRGHVRTDAHGARRRSTKHSRRGDSSTHHAHETNAKGR